MMKKGNAIRLVVNSVLFAIIIVLGIAFYQTGKKEEKSKANQAEELAQIESTEEEFNSTDEVGTSNVEAEVGEDTIFNQSSKITNMEESNNSDTIGVENSVNSVEMKENNTISTDVNFTENSLMEWPLNGTVLMDYSEDKTVYFKTLDQYKINPAILIEAQEGTEVKAACPGIVKSIEESAETGTTIVMDLGNGYEAVYGQLKDLQVVQGEAIDMGTILGYVNCPTKYYSTEGSNLYFQMSKDGNLLDPILYLP